MPTNQEARSSAMRLGASVIPYHQSEGMCDGLVSWWLRNQLQGKTIFRSKHFDRVQNVEAYMQEPEGRFVPSADSFAKGKALQVLFHDKQEDDTLYITRGVRSDKPDKNEKAVARFVHKQTSQPISDFATRDDNVNNLRRSFIEAAVHRYAAKISIKAITAHALGLDCVKSPQISYFDPNLGLFMFSSVEQLIQWWRACYQNRGQGGGAFGMFKYSFNADFYEPL
jgi:hypothetical protein